MFEDPAADRHSGYYCIAIYVSAFYLSLQLLKFEWCLDCLLFETGHIKGIGLSELGTVVRLSSCHVSRWIFFAGITIQFLNPLRDSRVIFEYMMLASYSIVVGASVGRNRHATVQSRGTRSYQLQSLPNSLSISEYDDRKGQVLPQKCSSSYPETRITYLTARYSL
jgi:hypothetical protein